MSETTSAKARNRSALLHQRFHAAPSRCAASRITTSAPAVESRATWGSIASLSPSPTRTARRFRSSTSRSRSSRICRNANPPMTISTESQMAPTRRIVSLMTVVAFSPRLEPQVLVRRGVGVVGDERQARLLHAWPVAIDKGELPDRRDHRLLVHELLDPLERRLAL